MSSHLFHTENGGNHPSSVAILHFNFKNNSYYYLLFYMQIYWLRERCGIILWAMRMEVRGEQDLIDKNGKEKVLTTEDLETYSMMGPKGNTTLTDATQHQDYFELKAVR